MKSNSRISAGIAGAVKAFAPLLTFVWLSLAAPLSVSPYIGWFTLSRTCGGLTESFAASFVVLLLPMLLYAITGRRMVRVIVFIFGGLIALLTWLLCYSELYCTLELKCRINESVLSLIRQTDSGEAGEFLHHAAGLETFQLALYVMLIPPGALLAVFFLRRFFAYLNRRFAMIILVVVLSVSTVAFILFNFSFLFGHPVDDYSMMITPLKVMYESRALANNTQEIENLRRANEEIEVASVKEKLPLVVVIIGESDKKTHSSLYGYELPTLPRLERLLNDSLKAKGVLVVFTDAVTGDCYTNLVMKRLLSTNNDTVEWHERPLLPAVLKKGGYGVMYFDNQTTPSNFNAIDYSSVYFMNDEVTGRQSFDKRNTERYPYDYQLIDTVMPDFLAAKDSTVVFLHLMGQHLLASSRYPAEDAVFTETDYQHRTDLPSAAIEDIMHYDNATVALDKLLGDVFERLEDRDAIVIYLSDHGEELYDYRMQYGRKPGPMTTDRAHTLYDVPMYIYMTPTFTESRPEIAESIRTRASSPVYTYWMPDFLLDICGLSTPAFAPERSFISSTYNASGARKIDEGKVDYDEVK